jgi:hypothetical protein
VSKLKGLTREVSNIQLSRPSSLLHLQLSSHLIIIMASTSTSSSDKTQTNTLSPDEDEYIGLLNEWILQIQEEIQKKGFHSVKSIGVVDFCLCFGFGPGTDGREEFVKQRDIRFNQIRKIEKEQETSWKTHSEFLRNMAIRSHSHSS